jgi:hypothetical protein
VTGKAIGLGFLGSWTAALSWGLSGDPGVSQAILGGPEDRQDRQDHLRIVSGSHDPQVKFA